MTGKLIILVVSFFIYCLMGWIWESIILPLSRHQKPYNRGFLNGPWIPIYGFGAMLVIVLFDIQQVNYPIYTLFISGGVVACLLEYITSYVMEKLFHRRWWDYSQKAFNLNGRVCLEGFICFGLFSVVAIDYVQPFFTSKLLLVDENILFVLSGVLSVLFIVDTIVSTHVALDIEKKLELVKQVLEESENRLIANIEEKQTGKRDGASCIELQDRVHRRRGDEIDIFKRFLQNGDVFRKTVRHSTVFRHDEVASILNGDEPCTAGALVHGELFRVFERIGAFDLKICLRFIGLRWA